MNDELEPHKKIKNIKHFNETQFQLEILDQQWDPHCTNINIIADKLVDTITKVLNVHC